MRVLIADDQRDVGRALANLVRICNHEVVEVVSSGLEAIHAYNRYHPDLVLMDYRMPKLNGATACRNILAKDPSARVILVTAWSPSDDAAHSGAIAILPKPVDFERLNATLLTIAQSIPTPESEEAAEDKTASPRNTPEQFTSESAAFESIPIPPEIISPVETFPSTTFPIETSLAPHDVDQNVEGHAFDEKKSATKRNGQRRKRARLS
jgi:two-component system, chemotaxis family, chemotaxis protein CheY